VFQQKKSFLFLLFANQCQEVPVRDSFVILFFVSLLAGVSFLLSFRPGDDRRLNDGENDFREGVEIKQKTENQNVKRA
jgi:hypothetical protein